MALNPSNSSTSDLEQLVLKGLNTQWYAGGSVIFVNENENENGEKRENNEFVNEN